MVADHAAGWGECVVAFAGDRVVVAYRFMSATAGPTVVVGVGAPARQRARIGLRFTDVARSDEGASLRWSAEADTRCVQWEDRGIEVGGEFGGLAFPMTVPLLPLPGTLGADVIPRRVSGRTRLGRVRVDVPAADPLTAIAGRHRGVLVSGPSVVAEAVRAARALPGLRARRRAPEPM